MGDCHAPFCGSPGVRFPRATRRAATVANLRYSRNPDLNFHSCYQFPVGARIA